MAHGLTRKFLSYLNKKSAPTEQVHISADESGIKVDSGSGWGPVIAWDQITRIVAFKRDVYSHDVICLLIETSSKSVLEVNEGMPGWTELVNELPIRLNSARPYSQWFTDVAFPAFELSPNGCLHPALTRHPQNQQSKGLGSSRSTVAAASRRNYHINR